MKVNNKHLIFDFDGVIGDTYEAAISAHVLVGNFKTRTDAEAEMRAYVENKPNHTKNHTLSEQEMSNMYKWVSGLGEGINSVGFSLFDEFVTEVESITTEHKAVVSSGTQHYVIPALAKTNINPTHILAFEDHHSKEEKIEIVCRDWGVAIHEVYYFTDTLADVYELKEFIAPEKLIGVSWGFCSKEQLLGELPAAQILDTPKDIHSVIKI